MPVDNLGIEIFKNLKNQVDVLIGGEHGVGESVVTTLYNVGAHIVFGDIDEAACLQLMQRLKKSHLSSTGSLA